MKLEYLRGINQCFIIVLTLFFSCNKKDNTSGSSSTITGTPKVNTLNVTAIFRSKTSVRSECEVKSVISSQILERGVCWSETDSFPTISNSYKKNGSGVGIFIDTITGLKSGTNYFIRSYAKTSNSVIYGNVISVLTNQSITGLKFISNDVGGIQWEGSAFMYFGSGYELNGPFEYLFNKTEVGFCYSTSNSKPTIRDSKVKYLFSNGSKFTMTLKPDIKPTINTTYYIRAYAFNSIDTVYAEPVITITTGIEKGLYFGGGVIFNVNGQHGLIVSLDELGETTWVPSAYNTQAFNTISSNGAINTTEIISKCGNSGTYAAKLCRDYRAGGFSDWYLPSSLEFQYLLIAATEQYIYNFPPANVNYWTSNEKGFSRAYSWGISGMIGAWSSNLFDLEKSSKCRVRAIRSF